MPNSSGGTVYHLVLCRALPTSAHLPRPMASLVDEGVIGCHWILNMQESPKATRFEGLFSLLQPLAYHSSLQLLLQGASHQLQLPPFLLRFQRVSSLSAASVFSHLGHRNPVTWWDMGRVLVREFSVQPSTSRQLT